MPSSTPFILQDEPADGGSSLRRLAPGIAFGDAYFWSRPEGEVEACNSVSIRFVTAFDTFEVAVAFPIFLSDVPTPWACLACVAGLDFLDEYTFSFSHAFESMSEEAVWNAVDLFSALLAPFSLTLSKMLESLNSYVCFELLSKFDDFVGYLPHPCSDVASLLPTKPLKFKPSLAGAFISVALKPRPSLFKPELFYRDVLTEICLLQHFVFADDGYCDFRTVNIYTHPVQSNGWFWKILRENYEEPEVSLHNDACYIPAFLEMLLDSLICTILAYWDAYSLVVEPKAENWVSSFGLFEAEESLVKSDDAFLYAFIYSFSYAPRIACSLYDELGRHVMLTSENIICLLMQFSPRPYVADVAEGLFNKVEEAFIGLLEQSLLSLSRLENVQRQALSRRRPHNKKGESVLKNVATPIPPTSKEGGLPCGGLVNFPFPLPCARIGFIPL